MNAHNRNHFTGLLPCRLCGMEPMRIYRNSTDRYAVKCDCGKRTAGFTTIAGASRSWNAMNKKEPPPVCKTEGRQEPKSKAIVRPESEICQDAYLQTYWNKAERDSG